MNIENYELCTSDKIEGNYWLAKFIVIASSHNWESCSYLGMYRLEFTIDNVVWTWKANTNLPVLNHSSAENSWEF